MRLFYLFVLVAAVVGAVLAGVAYFVPNTGVDGTTGALLALVGAVAVAVGAAIALAPPLPGWLRGLLNVLLLLGAALSALAAWFLMQFVFAGAMAVAFVGVLLALFARPSRRTA